MDFLKSIQVAVSGLKAQSGRMRVISENIANADSLPQNPNADPYRRKVPTFERRFDRELEAETVRMGKISRDQSTFKTRFEPGHPAADRQGYVKLPNVSSTIESMDLREAQRSYEANLNVVSSTRRMIQRTLELLRA
ncbi:MAG: flagellar basal body rod protein FlgC [Methylocystis sp.]|nr:flagellar basal body rod protein FlgC [Methylocystis sp.]MCA3583419.1 flagellar basal body rod protein FlgC [Methylocystis sp.]MCA3589120.1 flagellar basal body rod protein FlgC [Methylocystis sp.]MCA3591938.1 flagellar basal body rod protein FlgC [Methylocystis sp.]